MKIVCSRCDCNHMRSECPLDFTILEKKALWNAAVEAAALIVDIELYQAKDRLAREIRKLKK